MTVRRGKNAAHNGNELIYTDGDYRRGTWYQKGRQESRLWNYGQQREKRKSLRDTDRISLLYWSAVLYSDIHWCGRLPDPQRSVRKQVPGVPFLAGVLIGCVVLLFWDFCPGKGNV